MRRNEATVVYTAEELEERRKRGESRIDWARVDAMTEEELERAIAADPDADIGPIDWPCVQVGIPRPRRTSTSGSMPMSSTGSRPRAGATRCGSTPCSPLLATSARATSPTVQRASDGCWGDRPATSTPRRRAETWIGSKSATVADSKVVVPRSTAPRLKAAAPCAVLGRVPRASVAAHHRPCAPATAAVLAAGTARPRMTTGSDDDGGRRESIR